MKKVSLSPNQIRLPQDSQRWIEYCAQIVRQTPTEIQSLKNKFARNYKIVWYLTNPSPNSNRSSKTVLFCSPHSDDLPLVATAATHHHIKQGDTVLELLFTNASTGRESRGFADNESFLTVRLAEDILSSQITGVNKIGIITLPDGTSGFSESRWRGDDPTLSSVWESIVRTINPHIMYSPHPDLEADRHPDHHAVAKAVERMIAWGTENDFWQGRVPGKADRFLSWRRYATWGKGVPNPNLYFEYDPEGDIPSLRQKALDCFVSQAGSEYGKIGNARALYLGGMQTVGTGKIKAREVFDELTPATVIAVE
ncbi:hypothetical protein A3D77_01500 [Candidatus Gottesmanbacteria bacterium RIFCSPHIGHO2_02_FULL_39_11]|uniref:GlcNAc-PI de-N-acetylase n=1 Tax=Candidatus Gottesmanbacteria bacterium RIFCSPHIGHO2_02_FULL_39_11 TaxID=1798382 RepID=A0A1F5ZTM2_9BACT|nr:MAG: hypothetical protein A3D77_01500 [Candidatus Gottesmanbacteria bacterium RIFCSPHIGHO2_02_FULL_39_11]